MENISLVYFSNVIGSVNKTGVKEFILVAFSDIQELEMLLFIVFLMAYVLCVMGNIVILALVSIEPSLKTPMYFFIGTLSALEIILVSVTVPKLLANLIAADNRISITGCFGQLYAFNALGVTECYLLAVMSFDRDLAINNPLHYMVIMSKTFYTKLAILPWVIGLVIAFFPTVFTARLEFCGPNTINHFFCDLAPLQNLACSDPFISNVVTSTAAIFATVIPFFTIMGFYIHIIATISKIKSFGGKQKAFSTCSSHLIVASMFFGTAIIVYVRPKGSKYDKFLALMYTVFTPLLNPFIYTLRNKTVMVALRKSRSLKD
ncbi:olfactory receptor 10AG1-like [Spea bombifrons]|uniref:olfactory receptor 10AG1-like n=1 Tax=Spea bombifrons TaxID=233779 RepID=UPI00234B149F|nr:olfactory receptor 10AG1-like [Spea bombifrons]